MFVYISFLIHVYILSGYINNVPIKTRNVSKLGSSDSMIYNCIVIQWIRFNQKSIRILMALMWKYFLMVLYWQFCVRMCYILLSKLWFDSPTLLSSFMLLWSSFAKCVFDLLRWVYFIIIFFYIHTFPSLFSPLPFYVFFVLQISKVYIKHQCICQEYI